MKRAAKKRSNAAGDRASCPVSAPAACEGGARAPAATTGTFPWRCPKCGAGYRGHGRGKCRTAVGPYCDGLVCDCQCPTARLHGGLGDPCQHAVCDHCGWRGTMPAEQRKSTVVGWTVAPDGDSRLRICRGVEGWYWLHVGGADLVRRALVCVWPTRAAALDAARALYATNPRVRRVVRRG